MPLAFLSLIVNTRLRNLIVSRDAVKVDGLDYAR
jgi:hypothetical protein